MESVVSTRAFHVSSAHADCKQRSRSTCARLQFVHHATLLRGSSVAKLRGVSQKRRRATFGSRYSQRLEQ